jgi:hypothetical protein
MLRDPTTVLLNPVVIDFNAKFPNPTLSSPVVIEIPALVPANKFVDPGGVDGGTTCFGSHCLVVESYTKAIPSVGNVEDIGTLFNATAEENERKVSMFSCVVIFFSL